MNLIIFDINVIKSEDTPRTPKSGGTRALVFMTPTLSVCC